MSDDATESPIRYRGIVWDFRLIGRTIRLAFAPQGRSRRIEYAIYLIVGGWIAALVALSASALGIAQALLVTMCLYLVPMPALIIRRLHDMGYSGWWSTPLLAIGGLALALSAINGMSTWNLLAGIAALEPFIGLWSEVLRSFVALSLLYLMLKEQGASERYGPDPR